MRKFIITILLLLFHISLFSIGINCIPNIGAGFEYNASIDMTQNNSTDICACIDLIFIQKINENDGITANGDKLKLCKTILPGIKYKAYYNDGRVCNNKLFLTTNFLLYNLLKSYDMNQPDGKMIMTLFIPNIEAGISFNDYKINDYMLGLYWIGVFVTPSVTYNFFEKNVTLGVVLSIPPLLPAYAGA